MNQTLVVSDNEILNQLYLINLEVYLGTKVTIVQTTQAALELVGSSKKLNLIITVNMINGHDAAQVISDYLINEQISIPLIVVGNPTNILNNVTVIPTSFNLQNLLKTSAQFLGVTAKSMTTLEVPEYFGINVNFLMQLRKSPCVLYIEMKKTNDESNYMMVAKSGSDLTTILKKFFEEGIEKIFVNKFDRLILINQVSSLICDTIKKVEKQHVKEKSKALEAGFDFIASDFCRTPEASQDVMNIAALCSKVMEEIARENPGLKALLDILTSNKSGFLYSHSILASYIGAHIVQKISWGGEGHIEKINFVLFFHDIMLAPLYKKHPDLKFEEDQLFNVKLSDDEKDLVLNHARLAAELIINYKRAPLGVDLLIKQHHGMTNGIGFAIDYKDDISPLSKVIIIAEAFVEEYAKRKESDPQYQIDLTQIIPILHERFNKSTYKKIISTLETLYL